MRAFILAAGFGTRLKPLTDSVPKALIPICGEPLLSHNLRILHNSGIFSAIGVNSHYLHGQMIRFQENSPVPFELFYEEGRIRGTGGALYFAREFLSKDDTFLVANVDIIHKFDLRDLASRFISSGRVCSLVSVPVNSRGTVLYDNDTGDFLGVGADRDVCLERGLNFAEAEFTGLAFYRKTFINFVNDTDFSVIPIWRRASEGGQVPQILAPDKSASWWADIGTHEALAKIRSDVKRGEVDLWN